MKNELADRIEKALMPRSICRDCADNDGRCPNSGEFCNPTERAKELSNAVRNLNGPLHIIPEWYRAALMRSNGEEPTNLELFVEMYQPSGIIPAVDFRDALLKVLNNE